MTMIEALAAVRFDLSKVCRPIIWKQFPRENRYAIAWSNEHEWIQFPTPQNATTHPIPSLESILVPWEVLSKSDLLNEIQPYVYRR